MFKLIYENIYSYLIVVTLATFLSLGSEIVGSIFFFLFLCGWFWHWYNPPKNKFAGWMYSGRLYDDLNKIPEKFRKLAGEVYYE